MNSGFAKECITPRQPVRMFGFPDRDVDQAFEAVNDDLFVKAAYFEHEGTKVVIIAYDLLLFSNEQNDRYAQAVCDAFGFEMHQVMINTSHTHSGPMLSCERPGYMPDSICPKFRHTEKEYSDFVEQATLKAVRQAINSACPCTLWAGQTISKMPISRRKLVDGKPKWAPNSNAVVYKNLPVCMTKDERTDEIVSVIFSVSCHPSTIYWRNISAEYPGVATKIIDDKLTAEVSMFLQGCAGDAKPSVIVRDEVWNPTGWNDVVRGGELVAAEVLELLDCGLAEIKPEIFSSIVTMDFALEKPLSESELLTTLETPHSQAMRKWARSLQKKIDAGEKISENIEMKLHMVNLGKGLCFIGINSEVIGELGHQINNFFSDSIVFPMGYTSGTLCYLPTTKMIEHEGGYDIESYWEYGLPAKLKPGVEEVLDRGLKSLRA